MKIIYASDGTELMVSDCDLLYLCNYNWRRNHGGYYLCTNRSTFMGQSTQSKPMHWFVAKLMGLKLPEGFTPDHINQNKLDNQRCNIRAASKRLQAYNRPKTASKCSGLPGVYFEPNSRKNPWVTRIRYKFGYTHLGCFPTKEKASKVFQKAKQIRN